MDVEVLGTVTTFEVETDQTDQSPSNFPFALPLVFEGSITDHNIALHPSGPNQSTSSTPCGDSMQTVLSMINRDLIVVPQRMSANQSWQDSTLSTICSGALPLVVAMVRTYKIAGETIVDGTAALKLERTEKLLTSGQGSQGQHQISLNGAGTGKALVYIDRETGVLLSLTAANQSEISIKSSGKIQNFTQTSQEIVVKKTPW